MHLSTLPRTGPLLDMPSVARRLSDSTTQGLSPQGNTFDVMPQQERPSTSALARTDPWQTSAASLSSPVNLTPQPTPASTTTEAAVANSATELPMAQRERQDATNTQRSAQAFQEYAKAWGGRVVHGEVELPPLSIYVE